MSNSCYKNYTMKKSLDRLLQSHVSEETLTSPSETHLDESLPHSTRSKLTHRAPPNNNVDMYTQSCVICGHVKHQQIYEKYRISESESANKFLAASVYFQDSVFVRTCDLQNVHAVFGADLYYHGNYLRAYMKQYERQTKDTNERVAPHKTEVFGQVVSDIGPHLEKGEGYILSDIREHANNLLTIDSSVPFTNQEIRVLLLHHYMDAITFSRPQEANKSSLVFFKTSTAEQMADNIRSSDPIIECARVLRRSILDIDFGLQDKFCDSHDLETSWDNIVIPNTVLNFFALLFNFNARHFNGENEDDDSGDEGVDTPPMKKVSQGKKRKMLALFQIMYYIMHNGRKRTPLHMMNGQAIHETCKSSTLIKSFNHFGLSVSYDEILRYHSDLASLTVTNSQSNVPLPSHFNTDMFTTAAFDNFDHEEATLSGIGGSHDTVSVIFQDKPTEVTPKPNISDSNVIHGSKVFNCELPCQVVKEFIKPAKKPDIHDDYSVQQNLYSMDKQQHDCISNKDIIWSVSRLDLSKSDSGTIGHSTDHQTVPSWTAFNSIITKEDLTEKVVGFLPLIPQPVTEYATVYTALKNFQNVLGQLKQDNLAITCDEGVYHIAREITMLHKEEFKNIVLCLGSFHMIKVLLGCLGKYIQGSGAETIFIETSIFGINVVQSVLGGTNYVRSVKGMMLLSEAMDRLRWCQFFKENGTANYMQDLHLLNDLKAAIVDKKRVKSQQLMDILSTKAGGMLDHFQLFVDSQRELSQTFAFWDNFIQLVALLKDLIRADREGNWVFHLNTVQNYSSHLCNV